MSEFDRPLTKIWRQLVRTYWSVVAMLIGLGVLAWIMGWWS